MPGRCPERVRAAARAGLVASPFGRRPACGGAREQGKDFADGPLAAGGLWQWQMRLDPLAALGFHAGVSIHVPQADLAHLVSKAGSW